MRIAFCTANFQIYQEKPKFDSSFHFVKEVLKQKQNVSKNLYKFILCYEKYKNFETNIHYFIKILTSK